jgi:hypothetical protein
MRPAGKAPALMAVARAIAQEVVAKGSAKSGALGAALGGTSQGGKPGPARSSSRVAVTRGEAVALRKPVKASKRSDQARLAELKVKLGDEDYMNGAILRIATVLSSRLTLR